MAFCIECGTNLPDEAKFCFSCGKAVAKQGSAAPSSEKPEPRSTCPGCGASIPGMSAICQYCGFEIRNIQVSSVVKEFFERLDDLDQQIFEYYQKRGPLGGALGAMMGLDAMAKMYTGGCPGEKRKKELITNFPIPNSKEDIFEFTIMACSKINNTKVRFLGNPTWMIDKIEVEKINKAWITKIKQAYNKAKIAFGSDGESMRKLEKIIKESGVKV